MFDLIVPSFFARRFRWIKTVSKATDLVFLTDGRTAAMLPSNVRVLRQGIGDDVRPGEFKPELDCDVAFLGHGGRGRKSQIRELEKRFGVRFKHFDTKRNPVRGGDLSDLMASAKVIVGPFWPRCDGYWSNRIYIISGYGGCFAGPEIKGMADEGWISGDNYIAVEPTDYIDKIEEAAANESLRNRIRLAGHQHCLSKFRYDDRVRELLGYLQEVL